MTTPALIQSYWRKLLVSLQQSSQAHLVPEYIQHQDRAKNYRYYR